MSTTGSVRGFTEFDDLCRGHQGYSYNLAQLFDICDLDNLKRSRHTVCFKEALRRLKTKIKDSFFDLELHTERKITDFTVGKTFVKSKIGAIFNPMKPTTWSLGGGINGRWQDYKADNYDGLIVIGCIERDLIPEHVRECNKNAIPMNQQNYALGLEQALIQYFSLYKPDARLRNKSFDIGNTSREVQKGGIVYVAYKLEPEPSYSDEEYDDKKHTSTLENSVAIDRLKLKLEEDGLFFRCDIPNDGNSFFRACSDQLKHIGLPEMDHKQLRQLITSKLRNLPEDKVKSLDFTTESWNSYIDNIAAEGEVVGNIIVETMARFWRRQIVVYSRSYPDEITGDFYNDDGLKNGPPLLLAKEKLYFQSIEKREGTDKLSTSSPLKEEGIFSKRPANTVSFDENPPPEKKTKQTQNNERMTNNIEPSTAPKEILKDSTTSEAEKKSNEEMPSPFKSLLTPTTSTDSSNNGEPQNTAKCSPKQSISDDEKKLILRCFIQQTVKSDWDKLTETVRGKRHEWLSRKTIEHYDKHLTEANLKRRIKTFIQAAQNGKRENEKDAEVQHLIALILKPKNERDKASGIGSQKSSNDN